jgi:hypothetical protein
MSPSKELALLVQYSACSTVAVLSCILELYPKNLADVAFNAPIDDLSRIKG